MLLQKSFLCLINSTPIKVLASRKGTISDVLILGLVSKLDQVQLVQLSNKVSSVRFFKVLLLAVAAIAQSVKRPELRSLKEVQLSLSEFDCRLQHRSY